MIRWCVRLVARLARFALLAWVVAAVARLVQSRRAAPAPVPVAPVPVPAPLPPPVEAPATWVAPEGMACPAAHPVKAKLSSGIYHLPGMSAYERTRPDRCYGDAAGAEADGLTRAKR